MTELSDFEIVPPPKTAKCPVCGSAARHLEEYVDEVNAIRLNIFACNDQDHALRHFLPRPEMKVCRLSYFGVTDDGEVVRSSTCTNPERPIIPADLRQLLVKLVLDVRAVPARLVVRLRAQLRSRQSYLRQLERPLRELEEARAAVAATAVQLEEAERAAAAAKAEEPTFPAADASAPEPIVIPEASTTASTVTCPACSAPAVAVDHPLLSGDARVYACALPIDSKLRREPEARSRCIHTWFAVLPDGSKISNPACRTRGVDLPMDEVARLLTESVLARLAKMEKRLAKEGAAQ